jgi:hypothetical protein
LIKAGAESGYRAILGAARSLLPRLHRLHVAVSRHLPDPEAGPPVTGAAVASPESPWMRASDEHPALNSWQGGDGGAQLGPVAPPRAAALPADPSAVYPSLLQPWSCAADGSLSAPDAGSDAPAAEAMPDSGALARDLELAARRSAELAAAVEEHGAAQAAVSCAMQ